jgi:DHA3 family tetracycline resistance protein-like MFS transporter
MKKLAATRAYLLATAIDSIARGLIFVGLTTYYVRTIGMSPLELVLVGTAIELTCFLFEVPTGIVADTVSRRLSVIIGGILIGICYVLSGLLPFFLAIVIAEVIRGIGETFISGAFDAWITDEVGAENVGPVNVRAMQFAQGFSLIGSLISVVLATWYGYQTPILIGGVLMIGIFVLMAFVMPETGFKPAPREDRNTFAQMAHTFTAGAAVVRGSTVLLLMIGLTLIVGVASEGFDRLWEAHVLTSFALPALTMPVIGALDAVAWFAVLDIGLTVISMTLLEVIRRRLNLANDRHASRALLVLNTIGAVATIVFAFAGNFWLAVIAYLTRSIANMLMYPIQGTWMNQHIPSAVRATVLSMNSQVNAFGQIAGGPGVGWVGNRYGVRSAIGLSGLMLLPALALYARFVRRDAGADMPVPSDS